MTRRKLILVVIDGLTPGMLEGAMESGTTPVLAALADPAGVAQQYADAYGRFRERFCAWEDGQAAARVIDAALR